MSWFSTSPEPGDLVAAARDLPLSLTEHLTGAVGVARGTRGLVRTATPGRLGITFDTGYGTTLVHVRTSDVSLVRRGIDESRFHSRAALKASIRVGALIAITAPLLWFAIVYWMQSGSLEGLPQAIAISALESALELPDLFLAHPIQTLCWLSLSALIGRIAFGPNKARKQ